MSKVFVTGIGIISAIGNDTTSTLKNLLEMKSGIGKMSILKSVHADRLPVGEVKLSNAELISLLDLNVEGTYSRTLLLGLKAAREAWIDSASLEDGTIKSGFISATSVGGMDLTEQIAKEYFSEEEIDTSVLQKHPCGNHARFIANQLGVKDHVSTVSTACSSSANAIMMGARLIKHNLLDRVIVGGADALTKFTLNGFDSLRILDSNPTKAFDNNRQGLNLGEGAAYLVLEAEELVEKTSKKTYCEVKGYANTNDAFHQTASSPDGNGAYLAMKNALKIAKLDTTSIDYINAHGTGTENNDLSEGAAIKRLFAEVPSFSSTKPYTGHTLAASASIESVFSCLMLENKVLFPNLNFDTPIEELGISPITEVKKEEKIATILSNSFGFGGNCSTVIYQKK